MPSCRQAEGRAGAAGAAGAAVRRGSRERAWREGGCGRHAASPQEGAAAGRVAKQPGGEQANTQGGRSRGSGRHPARAGCTHPPAPTRPTTAPSTHLDPQLLVGLVAVELDNVAPPLQLLRPLLQGGQDHLAGAAPAGGEGRRESAAAGAGMERARSSGTAWPGAPGPRREIDSRIIPGLISTTRILRGSSKQVVDVIAKLSHSPVGVAVHHHEAVARGANHVVKVGLGDLRRGRAAGRRAGGHAGSGACCRAALAGQPGLC